MESQKIYMGSGTSQGTDLMTMLIPAIQNRGLDTNAVMAMLGGGGFGGFGSGGWNGLIALVVIAALFGWGGNGNGLFGGGNNGNDASRELIMSTLNRNGLDVSQMASTLNCSIGQINSAINAVASQVNTLAGQQGVSAQQIINAVQSGHASTISQLCSCCCEIKTAIERQGYENRLATIEQTGVLGGKIDAQTAKMIEIACAAEKREMQREISSLHEAKSTLLAQLSNEHQTAAVAQIVGQAVNPLGAALAGLQREVDAIKCRLPETATVPASPVVGIPTCLAAQMGLAGYGFGFGNGFWG